MRRGVDDPKVLFIFHEATLTGAPIALFRVLQALREEPATAFSFMVHLQNPGPLLAQFSAANIPFVYDQKQPLGSGSELWHGVPARIRYYLSFIRLVLRYRPGVAYSNTVLNNDEVTLARILGVRTIVHVHEAESVVARLRRRLTLSRPFTTRYVAVSEYVKAVLGRMLRVDSVVIYNGVDLSETPLPGASRVQPADSVLAVVGSVCPNKGQLLAVEALAGLLASGHRVRLKLIGALADAEYVASVKQRARELGVESHMELVGERSPNDIYDGVDITLIPSTEETFSLVALEAMAHGVLVIAARTGGIPEIVRDGETGLLFGTGRADELTARVAAALTERPRMAAIVESARQQVADHFTLEKSANGVSRVILDTMKPTRRSV